MKPRQPFLETGLCAVAGIALADLANTYAPRLWPWALAAVPVLLAAAWFGSRKRQGLVWAALVAVFFFWTAAREAGNPGRLLAARTPPQGRVIHAQGWVDGEPSSRRFAVRLERVDLGDGWRPLDARVLVQWPGEDLPAYGDRVEIAGSLATLGPPRNPGAFDLPAYRRREGIYSQITIHYPKDAHVVGHGAGRPLIALALQLRHWMEKALARDLEDSPRAAGVIQSLVLGARGESLGEVRPLFQATGTLHLFAVSGMNIAMLAGMALWVLEMARVPRRGIALLIIPFLWAYALVTGLSPSSVRAAVMASLAFAGLALDRPALGWNTLGCAAVALLVWNPNQLFLPGFQLSFLLVAALLAAAGPVGRWMAGLGAPDPFLPRTLWTRGQAWRFRAWSASAAAFGVSLVAWAASLPLTSVYFHLFSPSTVPANLVAGALTAAMLALGLASAAAATCWGWLSITLNNANWLCAKALLWVLSCLAAVPDSHVYVETPALGRAPWCELEVLDLGAGGAIHLRMNDGFSRRDWMIDCGSASAFSWNVEPYLRSRGINRLDGLILTHGDSQHLGGGPALLDAFPGVEVVDSPYKDRSPLRRKLQALLAERRRGKSLVWRGDVLTLGPGVALHVLYPPLGRALRSANDKALVLRLDAERGGKTVRILLTSDAGFPTEAWLLENAARPELRADLLIMGKHNADLSGTPEFLAAVGPQLIVAAGAEFPPPERIDPAWAARVEAQGIALLRQDRTGAVRVEFGRDGSWSARGYLDGSFFRSRSR